jgi:hypothetical protein
MAGLTTPVGTASYPALFAPRLGSKPKPGDKAKYQLTILFTEEQVKSEAFAALKQAALSTAYEKWGDSDKTRDAIKRKAIKFPFITDERVPDGYKCMLRLNGNEPPGVVDRYPANPPVINPKTGKPSPRVITDPKEIYAGAQVKATVGVFVYDVDGNKGVSFGLRNVQKWADGERIDGRASATDEFDSEEQESASMDDGDAGGSKTVSKDDMNDLLG